MPEITYEVTVELTEAEIRKVAERDITRFSDPIMPVYIAACRQWVEENPGYSDGTVAVAINSVGMEFIVQRVDGVWCYAGQDPSAYPVRSNDIEIPHVIHTPPTMRDHLHAIGLSDDEISGVAADGTGGAAWGMPALVDACREAERG